MSVYASFSYDTPNSAPLELKATSSQMFVGLVEVEGKMFDEWGLQRASFVTEYLEQRDLTMKAFLEKYGIVDPMDPEAWGNLPDDASPSEALWQDYTEPFAGESARQWAGMWLELLENETVLEACWLYFGDEDEDNAYLKDELQQLIRQADCADRHGVKLRFSVA